MKHTKIYWMFVAAMLCSCATFHQTASLSSALPSSSPSSSEKTSSSSSVVPKKAHYLNCYVDNELYVTLKIYQGALLSLPTDPKKEGYIFAGWYFDEGIYQNQVKQVSFLHQELTEDFYSCYARFIEEQGVQYYVNFYVDSSLYSSTPLLSNEPIAMPEDPIKDDAIFQGWYLDEGTYLNALATDYPLSHEIDSDLSAYAYFVPKEHIPVAVWCGSYHFSVDDGGKKAALALKKAGVNQIIGLSPAFNSDFPSFCDYCAEIGMTLIPNPAPWNRSTSSFSSWDGTPPSWVSKKAIYGVLGQDEPGYAELDSLAEKKAVWEAGDHAEKKFFVNLRSSSFVASADRVSYSTYLDAVFSKIHPDAIGTDFYPLLASGNVFVSYFETIEQCAKEARDHDVPFCMSICAAQHNSTDGLLMMPTASNIAWQMGVAESFGATWLSHYVYASHEDDYTCMSDLHGNPQSLYSEVAGANSVLHAYDDISLKYEYLGTATYDEGNNNPMFDRLSNLSEVTAYGGISAFSATGGDVLVGIYREKGGNGMAFRFTNAFASLNASLNSAYRPFTMREITLSLTLSDCVSGTLYGKGNAQSVFAENKRLSFSIPSYGSLFLVLS
ncbi:MAG: InlB B-repeat-containing protein [Erysipelotrichaceae bacterium]|nr:InlB B-repeat-containing protein [Erysipelotrichaceae bacterium]